MNSTVSKFVFGALESAFSQRTPASVSPNDTAKMAALWGTGQPTYSGVKVDHGSTMAIPAIYRGINIISNGVSRVPFYVFNQNDDESKEYAKGHTSWNVVTKEPHPEMKLVDFFRTMTGWAIGWGNAVAHIYRPNWPNGGPVELTPFLPDRTYPVRITREQQRIYNIADSTVGKLYYVTQINNQEVAVEASECIHIRGYGPTPYWGYDIVTLLFQYIGGAIAKAQFGQRFYGQGANPSGFIQMPGHLTDEEAEERFKESVARGMEGMSKAHRVMLLEDGAKFQQLTIDPEKAQFIEGMEFDYRILANIIGIKVHKLIDGANSSYNSLEQANHEHRDDDLFPWIQQWEGEYNKKLLTERQRNERSHIITIDGEYLDGWVPYSEKIKGVVELKNNDLITRDEGRQRTNFNPSNDGNGNRFMSPMNEEFTDMKDSKFVLSNPDVRAPAPVLLPAPDDEDSIIDDEDDEDSVVVEDESISALEKGNELETAWLAKITTRLGKQAIAKLEEKGTADFIEWVDSLTTEAAPATIQESVDALYGTVIARLLVIIDNPGGNEKNLLEAVTAEVATWENKHETS